MKGSGLWSDPLSYEVQCIRDTGLHLVGDTTVPEGSEVSCDSLSPRLVNSHSSFLSQVVKAHIGMEVFA